MNMFWRKPESKESLSGVFKYDAARRSALDAPEAPCDAVEALTVMLNKQAPRVSARHTGPR